MANQQQRLARNVGTADRVIRVILGVVFLALLFAGHGFWPRLIFLILGVIGVVTGIGGICPLYNVFGISTNRGTPGPTPT